MRDHVVVCGLGHVGHRVVRLLRRLGEDVVVVALAPDEGRAKEATAAGARVIAGDARHPHVMAAAELSTARALIAATSSDITNIGIALGARRTQPGLAIVVRLFDLGLAGLFERSVEVRRALAMSALAAPGFVAAALDERVSASFALDGEPMVVVRLPADAAAAPAPEAQPLDGTPDALVLMPERCWRERRPPAPAARPAGWARPLRAAWSDAPRALRAAFFVLLALVAASVLVFWALMDLSLSDAVYFVVTTVTTTGYGDITPRDHGVALKLYACLLMVLGSCAAAVLFSFVTDFIVGERFRRITGKRPVPEGGHVVVAGLGNIGWRVVEGLIGAGVPAVAVEIDEAGPFNSAVSGQVGLVVGDARLPAILRAAGTERATAVVAATGDDAVNLAIGLAAREANPRLRVVVRLFDSALSHEVEHGLRIDAALSGSLLAAPAFVASALYAGVQAAFVDRGELVCLCEVPVEEAGGAPVVRRGAGGRVLVARRRALAPE